ncbi:protein binding protein, putative [Musa troglodytarum]|uniref:Protein binding protein, putative n=1 Tax=Musa troglodytarum TaxID=320322 RepID=A0A9E7JC82_9LILI|nr:protein binding protein, putative [Musa troglodytarum]
MGSDDGSHAAMSRDIGRRKRVREIEAVQARCEARAVAVASGFWGGTSGLSLVPSEIDGSLFRAKSKDCVVRSRTPSDSPPLPHPTLSKERRRRRSIGMSFHGSEEGSPTHRSPLPGCPNNRISSGSSFGSSSRSISDAEEKGEDKGEVEDWEAFADALSADQPNPNPVATIPESTAAPGNTIKDRGEGLEKPDAKQAVHRAWRPDDAFRPRSLPNLSKQRSFPASMERHYAAAGWAQHGILSTPSSCPICYEDLDPTDSSFLPCNCGFRLCLFCHKRILEEALCSCGGWNATLGSPPLSFL